MITAPKLRRILPVLILLQATPAAADDLAASISTQLRSQGYRHIEVSRTFLGRLRIEASAPGREREIIVNPRTGEILRDYAEGTTPAHTQPGLLDPTMPSVARSGATGQGAVGGDDGGNDGGSGSDGGNDGGSGSDGGDDGGSGSDGGDDGGSGSDGGDDGGSGSDGGDDGGSGSDGGDDGGSGGDGGDD